MKLIIQSYLHVIRMNIFVFGENVYGYENIYHILSSHLKSADIESFTMVNKKIRSVLIIYTFGYQMVSLRVKLGQCSLFPLFDVKKVHREKMAYICMKALENGFTIIAKKYVDYYRDDIQQLKITQELALLFDNIDFYYEIGGIIFSITPSKKYDNKEIQLLGYKRRHFDNWLLRNLISDIERGALSLGITKIGFYVAHVISNRNS